ncbi:ankyrin repeat domain-containing protein [Methylobacter sp. G7]|uniref:ankyrin repeat domain-containing protein n=1 Tax=Methylobacter sp. G7 TaxID=3230117 RepID=UPI003D803ABF
MNRSTAIFLTLWSLMVALPVGAEEIDIFTAAREGDVNAIKTCVLAGCNVNSTNSDFYTPFILAAYYGHNQVLETLLQQGANPCALDAKGSNAFMGVAFKGYDETVRWLLEHTQCDVNHQNQAGQTALMMASLFGREAIIKLLLEHGAKPDLADYQGNTAEKLAQAQGLSRIVEIIKFHIR